MDYQTVSQNLIFTNTTRDVTVTVSTTPDGLVEGDESFTLALSQDDMMTGVMLPDDPVTVTITDRTGRAIHTHTHTHTHSLSLSLSLQFSSEKAPSHSGWWQWKTQVLYVDLLPVSHSPLSGQRIEIW